jgi:hypothetical protein
MTFRRHGIGLLLLVFILPLLGGCPYESKVPLSNSGAAKIDTALLGEWKNTEEGEPFTMIIQQFNDHELLLLGIEDGKVQREVMRAFVTIVKDEHFLNVQEIKGLLATRGWHLANYAIAGKTLSIRIVDDKLITKPFISSRALYAFVKKNLRNKELYGDGSTMIFQRVGE